MQFTQAHWRGIVSYRDMGAGRKYFIEEVISCRMLIDQYKERIVVSATASLGDSLQNLLGQ